MWSMKLLAHIVGIYALTHSLYGASMVTLTFEFKIKYGIVKKNKKKTI